MGSGRLKVVQSVAWNYWHEKFLLLETVSNRHHHGAVFPWVFTSVGHHTVMYASIWYHKNETFNLFVPQFVTVLYAFVSLTCCTFLICLLVTIGNHANTLWRTSIPSSSFHFVMVSKNATSENYSYEQTECVFLYYSKYSVWNILGELTSQCAYNCTYRFFGNIM